MKNLNKLIITLLILLSTVENVSADPLTIDVIPINNQVQPGEIATYKVNLINGGPSTETLTNLYVLDGPGDFTYVFSKTSGVVLGYETKQVDLSVTVPISKSQGTYTFDVYADWQKTLGPFTIKKTNNYLDVILNVIPEFTTIAIPALISLGIIFLVFRRKRRN
ncbi:MAG: hypothetical protein ACE5J3_10305 [Methanosarcinales archaeon]